jgi:hypothetical protein
VEDFCNSEINCFGLSFFKQPRFFIFFFSFPRFLPPPTLALAKTKNTSQRYPKKEFLHAAAMIFSVKKNSSGIAIFPAVWEGHRFMETGVLHPLVSNNAHYGHRLRLCFPVTVSQSPSLRVVEVDNFL